MQTNSSAVYWSSFAYIGFSVTGQAYIILSHDTLFIVFMIHLVAQIKILKSKVEALYLKKGFSNSGTNFQLKINDEDFDGLYDLIGVSNSEWWIMELNSCIKYHQGILRHIDWFQIPTWLLLTLMNERRFILFQTSFRTGKYFQ